MKNKKGFTLIELLVIITIVGMIIAIVVPLVANGEDQYEYKSPELKEASYKKTAEIMYIPIKHNRHKFIFFYVQGDGLAAVHDPDCECLQNQPLAKQPTPPSITEVQKNLYAYPPDIPSSITN